MANPPHLALNGQDHGLRLAHETEHMLPEALCHDTVWCMWEKRRELHGCSLRRDHILLVWFPPVLIWLSSISDTACRRQKGRPVASWPRNSRNVPGEMDAYSRSKIRAKCAISPKRRPQKKTAARILVTLFRHRSTPNLDNLGHLIGCSALMQPPQPPVENGRLAPKLPRPHELRALGAVDRG